MTYTIDEAKDFKLLTESDVLALIEIHNKNINSTYLRMPKGTNGSNEVIFHLFTDEGINAYKPGNEIYGDRLESIFSAGKELINSEVKKENCAVYLHEISKIEEDVKSRLKDLSPDNNNEHEIALNIVAEATKKTAEVLKNAEKNNSLKAQHEPNYVNTDNWLKRIQAKDYELTSSKPRQPIINVYPVQSGGKMISYAQPITTVSSLSRKGHPPVLPNFWRSQSIHVDNNGQILSVRTIYRSASLDPFEVKDPEVRKNLMREIGKFEMRQYAFDRLEEKLIRAKASGKTTLTAQEVTDALHFSFLDMSLQSTIEFPGFPGEKKSILYAEEIYAELSNTLIDFEGFEERINSILEENNMSLDTTLSDLRIKPEIIYSNFGVNMIRGDDIKGEQSRINKKAKIQLQKLVENKIQSNDPDIKKAYEIIKVKNPITSSSLAQLKNQIKIIRKKSELNDADKKTVEILDHFYNFSKMNKSSQTNAIVSHLSNQSKENYLQQEAAIALGETLGCIVKVNCQSGKDRTGLEIAATEAAQVQRDSDPQHKAHIDQNVCWHTTFPNATHYTSGREITSVNCKGAKGLQGQNYLFISPNDPNFIQTIGADAQDRASRLHKQPYARNKKKVTNVASYKDRTLSKSQKNRFDALKDFLSPHSGKQATAEKNAAAANTEHDASLNKNYIDGIWEQTKFFLDKAETPKDEYETFAHLLQFTMQVYTRINKPGSQLQNSDFLNAWNEIKEKYYDYQSQRQGEDYNNLAKQQEREKVLKDLIEASTIKITEMRKNASEQQVSLANEKLHFFTEAREKTRIHIKHLIDNDKENDVIDTLEDFFNEATLKKSPLTPLTNAVVPTDEGVSQPQRSITHSMQAAMETHSIPVASDSTLTVNELYNMLEEKRTLHKLSEFGIKDFEKVTHTTGAAEHLKITMFCSEQTSAGAPTTEVKAENKQGSSGITYSMKSTADPKHNKQTIAQICELAVDSAKPGTVLSVPSGSSQKDIIQKALESALAKKGFTFTEGGPYSIPLDKPKVTARME